MVNPDTIIDGQYINLYCPDCQAHPHKIEFARARDGWFYLRCAYCLCGLNSVIEDEYVSTTHPSYHEFSERLFDTQPVDL